MAYIGTPAVDRFTASKAASVYSGNGSTVAFTLEHAVGSDEDILVSVDGVIQEPSVAYAVSVGTTLTFTAAPSSNSGNNIFVYYLFRTLGTVAHPATSALSATTGAFSSNATVGGTLGVTGVPTFTGRSVHSGGITIANAGQIGSVGDPDAIAISSSGVVTFSQTPVGAGISSATSTLPSEGGAATTIVGQGLAKGWYNFDGTGTIGMTDSFNMTSTTDHGVGEYTCSFTNDMGNATYCYAMGEVSNTGGNAGHRYGSNGVAAGTFRTQLKDSTNGAIDLDPLCAIFMGDLA